MATKKDLVEAYSFSRRRLVTAFLSGAPGGREVEPARPARTLVGGLALAILLVAGAAIASVLASRTNEDWNKVGLVVDEKTSAQYVILKEAKHPLLIPIANVTSAQLILGASGVTPTYVDSSVIENQTPGTLIGILGAPPLLPQPSQFIDQGWTSCTADKRGMTLNLSRSEHTEAQPGRAAVVDTVNPDSGAKSYYLIAESSDSEGPDRRAYAYEMPHSGRLDQALRDVGLDAEASATEVPDSWVRLFPQGGPLTADSFPIPDFGQPPPPDIARYLPADATIGQYYDSGSERLVLTDKGTVELDAFSMAVYKETRWGTGKQAQPPTALAAAPDARLRGAAPILDAAHWPSTQLQAVDGQLCAQLDVHADQEPGVSLRSDPSSVVAASENSSTTDPPVFSVDRGQGAYVMVGDWNDTSSTSRVVVDPRGAVYPLIGADTITKLGYDQVSPPLVPDTWIRLMQAKVSLSTNAALCPPTSDDAAALSSADDPSADASAGASAGPSTEPSATASDSGGTQEGATPNCQEAPQ